MELEKEQTTQSRRKERIKIRAEINGIETRRATKRSTQLSCFFKIKLTNL